MSAISKALILVCCSLSLAAQRAEAQPRVTSELLQEAQKEVNTTVDAQGKALAQKADDLAKEFDKPDTRDTRKAVEAAAADATLEKLLELSAADLKGQGEIFIKAFKEALKKETDGFPGKFEEKKTFARLAALSGDLVISTARSFGEEDSALVGCAEKALAEAREKLNVDLKSAFATGAKAAFVQKFKDGIAGAANPTGIKTCVGKRTEALQKAIGISIIDLKGEVQETEALERAQLAKQEAVRRAEEYLDEIRGQGDGPLDEIICDWSSPTGAEADRHVGKAAPATDSLSCHNKALLLGGDLISKVVIRGLPDKEEAKVSVRTGELFIAYEANCGPEDDPKTGKISLKHNAETVCPPDLGSDSLEVEPGMDAVINVYVDRLLYPRHRGYNAGIRNRTEAAQNLRGNEHRTELSVITRGGAVSLSVAVKVGEQVRTAEILMVYKRWSFEAGGFVAFSNVADEELATDPIDGKPNLLKIREVRPQEDTAQESGAFLTFFPRNYPMVGIGLGFATKSSRAPSIYFGPSIRLLDFNDRAVLTFAFGGVLSAVRRFPDVAVGDELARDSARLQGRIENEFGGFVLFSLGFQFGPIPGSSNK